MKLIVGAAVLAAGCLYVDPLNDPPVIRATCTFPDSGRACDGNATIHHGERIELQMQVDDPDDNEDPATYRWAAFTCPETDITPDCAALTSGTLRSGFATVVMPVDRAGARTLSIRFEASDLRGASDTDSLLLPVDDAPVLTLRASGPEAAIGLFATFGARGVTRARRSRRVVVSASSS